MTFRTTMAMASVATLLCSLGGVAAQTTTPSNYYHTNSTPEEMAKTQALNAKQAEMRGVTASGETGTAVDASSQSAMKEYEEKLRANEEQQKLYQQQMEEYKRKYGEPGATYKGPARS